MAKRRRLTPPQPDYLDAGATAPAIGAGLRAPEVKSSFPPLPSAPIAQVAGEASAAAALREVAAELIAARSEGRLIQRLGLEEIDAAHLVRDRIAFDGAEMEALRESLRARGQQTPIEVVDLGADHPGPARYGLISGLRRLRALESLAGGKSGTVLAVLRQPAAASDAYLAMVEENEIRVGLTYYERARIVWQATALGVYPSAHAALRALFPTASRAKRSKIGSFLAIYQTLDGDLRFATAIPERLGLALSQALEQDAALGYRLRAALKEAPPASEAEELAFLSRFARTGGKDPEPAQTDAQTDGRNGSAQEVAAGIWMEMAGGAGQGRLVLSGPGVGGDFPDRLRDWLRG